MTEQEFLNWFKNKVDQLHEQNVVPFDKAAKDCLIIDSYLKNNFFQYIDLHKNEDRIVLRRSNLVEVPSDVDLRCFMSDVLLNEIALRGFTYLRNHSNADELIFIKTITP